MKLEVNYRGYRAQLICTIGADALRPGRIDPETPTECLTFLLNNQWRKINMEMVRALREDRVESQLKREIDREIDTANKLRVARWQKMDAARTKW